MSRYSTVSALHIERFLTLYDRLRFSTCRADYYEYLAAIMHGTQGGRTFKEIFEYDVRRYGSSTVRGRLSLHWARAYQTTGGDLYTTWLGCFPLSELGLIRVAQASGNTSLANVLKDLALVLRLVQQTKSILAATLWSAVLACAMLVTMLLAVPLFTVPRLKRVFSAVPPEFYARLTRSLFEFAAFAQEQWLSVVVLTVGSAALILWSLPNLTGNVRQRLEDWSIWKIYRCVNSMRFLSVLTIVLARQNSTSTQLRTALVMQRVGATKWQDWHIDAMLARINIGLVGAETFNTGILDQDLFWFLSDMSMARGLPVGLELTRQRLKDKLLTTVARQALVLRWCLLLLCVAGLLGLGLWHYAVIDELRRSLMLFYASQ